MATKKPKSLKIERKKKKAKKQAKIRLTIKVAKVDRTARKIKAFAKKSLKSAIKGLKGAKVKKIPERLYRKIDAAIAGSADLKTIVDEAVVKMVNDNLLPKKKEKAEA